MSNENSTAQDKNALLGNLTRIIQGYKSYEFWKTNADNCGRTVYALTDDVVSSAVFDLEIFAFALHINEPIKINSYNDFEGVIDFETPGTLLYYQ